MPVLCALCTLCLCRSNRLPGPVTTGTGLNDRERLDVQQHDHVCVQSPYVLMGSAVCTCEINGQWSGVQPTCVRKYMYQCSTGLYYAFPFITPLILSSAASFHSQWHGSQWIGLVQVLPVPCLLQYSMTY